MYAPSRLSIQSGLGGDYRCRSERTLALVLGNIISTRLSSEGMESVIDRVMTDIRQDSKRAEVLKALEQCGITYVLADGLVRQKDRDRAYSELTTIKRDDERRSSTAQ